MSIVDEMNLPTQEQMDEEYALYERARIPRGTMPASELKHTIFDRPTKWVIEKVFNLPQNIFFIELDSVRLVGRKLISELKLRGKLKELNCSGVSAEMLLGIYDSDIPDEHEVRVSYYPFTNGEKLYYFDKLKSMNIADLYYPFRYLDKETKLERTSPEAGWSLDPMRANNLGIGEEHIREYTIDFLSKYNMKDKLVYDPACSTGQFLHTIKMAFPSCHTIGQDLSQDMVNYASNFVDEIYCGDAFESFIPNYSVDFAFCRFLNSEVVTTDRAKEIFPRIVKRVKRKGIVIVFGHTPVLLRMAFFQKSGLQVLRTLAYHIGRNILFQYYVLMKGE